MTHSLAAQDCRGFWLLICLRNCGLFIVTLSQFPTHTPMPEKSTTYEEAMFERERCEMRKDQNPASIGFLIHEEKKALVITKVKFINLNYSERYSYPIFKIYRLAQGLCLTDPRWGYQKNWGLNHRCVQIAWAGMEGPEQ